MLSVRKPKLGAQNSQIEWTQSRQWKGISEMRIANWNVPTLYRALAMNELVKEMEKYNIDIWVLQESRWPGKGTVIKKNYTIIYSGHKSDKHEFGTGYYISRDITENLLNFEPVYERICKIRVIHKYYSLTLTSTHIQTEERVKYTKKNFIVLWRRYVMQFPVTA
jgi:exonuclease III